MTKDATAELVLRLDSYAVGPPEGQELMREASKALEALQAENERLSTGGCSYSGPGRGDCSHFVGLPGRSIPGQHDGPDDTVDCYGMPNGWCWSCWSQERFRALQAEIEALKHDIARSMAAHAESEVENGELRVACKVTLAELPEDKEGIEIGDLKRILAVNRAVIKAP